MPLVGMAASASISEPDKRSRPERDQAITHAQLRSLYLGDADGRVTPPPAMDTASSGESEPIEKRLSFSSSSILASENIPSSSSSSSSGFAARYGGAHGRHPRAGPSTMPIRHSPVPRSSSNLPASDLSDVSVHHHRPRTTFPPVRRLHLLDRKRILVTGGAGFLGSHLVDRLMLMGHDVMVMDNYFTGDKSNLAHWIGHPHFELVRHDVVNPMMVEVDQIYHLACPASPQHYQANQIKTLKTNFTGTLNLLGLAKRTKARFLLASTSEVYGDPEVTPQKESYNGNVNQTGPRACYDEGKRVAETITYGYLYQDNVDVRVARIFNTYGPRMNPFDGRVVSNVLIQALKGHKITLYGDGKQTRSFCYILDLIDGLIALMDVEASDAKNSCEMEIQDCKREVNDVHGPVNLGSSDEFTILELVDVVAEVVAHLRSTDSFVLELARNAFGSDDMDAHLTAASIKGMVEYLPMPADDPRQRRPDTTRAHALLQWRPRWGLREGVLEMARYYVQQMKSGLL